MHFFVIIVVVCFTYWLSSHCVVVFTFIPPSNIFILSRNRKLYHSYSMFMIQSLGSRKRETVSYLQYVYVLDFMYQKVGNCILPTVCLCSRFYVSESGKLYLTYSMFMFQILSSRKRETILPIVCLCSRFYVAESGKLYPINSMFMLQILCSRKRESVSYLQYVYVLDFMQQREGNCILPTVCLCSRFHVAERGNLYPTYSMFMFQILCSRKRETVSYLQYVYVLDFIQQKRETVSY